MNKYKAMIQSTENRVSVGLTRLGPEGNAIGYEVVVDIDLKTGRIVPSALLVDRIARDVGEGVAGSHSSSYYVGAIEYSQHDDLYGYDDYLVYVDETDEWVDPLTAMENTYVSKGNRKWKQDEWTGEEHRA